MSSRLAGEFVLAQQRGEIGDGVFRAPLHGPDAGPHQLEIGAVGDLAVRHVAFAVLHVAHPLAAQRVRAQVSHRAVFVEPPGLLQALEKGGHAAHVEAGLAQGVEAEAVGLALEVARVVELRLDAGRLPGQRSAHGHVRIAARRQNGHGQRQHGGQLRLPGLVHQSRQMVLADVGNLVGQHRSELRFAAGSQDQTGVHADIAPWHGEGVERGILEGKELELAAGLPTG